MSKKNEIQELGMTIMSIKDSTHKARVKIKNPKNVSYEFGTLYYWIETQIDTSGGRTLKSLEMYIVDGYLYSELTLGWLHGDEDRLLLEVAEEIKKTEKPLIEVL